MYIVCLTGTLCVFYPEFQRWEFANAPESLAYDRSSLQTALNNAIADEEMVTSHMYVYLPTEDRPILTMANERQDYLVTPDGTLGEPVESKWTDFLIDMHLYLTIPGTFGLILVSTLGAMLCALIISGLLAHPRIFKDAFKLRLGPGSRLEQVDIHNRLSVWGTPFYLLIAVTGAYFGLVLPLLGVVSVLTGKDPAQIRAGVFGEEPQVYSESQIDLETAFDNLQEIAPEAKPFRLIVHDAGTPQQFFEIMASHPRRVIYSENYRFDPEGNYLGKVGFSDGEVGRQIVYSMYYLHFGHFAGYVGKVIYFLLGLALTVVSVTGINIWLRKRSKRDLFNPLWAGIVWGVPLSLMIAMITSLILNFVSVPLFWASLVALLTYCVRVRDEIVGRRHLQRVSIVVGLLVVFIHLVKFGSGSLNPAAIMINACLLLYVGILALTVWQPWQAKSLVGQTSQA
ncbi:MAG: PepSY domain-containing protein [Pseudomonadales bacterium]|nr:PepSY domain-containing protein [Pseudomonadales bacterium]